MCEVTNQDGCHTTYMKNDGNWKYFLYGHVVYMKMKETQRGSDLSINKYNWSKYDGRVNKKWLPCDPSKTNPIWKIIS